MNAPRRVFAFLTGIDLTHYSRDRVCQATGLSPRTVDRALGKLVENKALNRERGGRATPAKIRILMSLDQLCQLESKMAHQVCESGAPNAQSGAPSSRIRALEVIQEQKQQPRKPMAVETNREPKAYIPDPTGWSGSPILNPAWVAWRDRELRIGRARNPAAYRVAVERRA